MHSTLFVVIVGLCAVFLGTTVGVLIACMAASAARADDELDRWRPTICTARPAGVSCLRLALPGTTTCRQHSLNPVTRNPV